MKIKKITPKYKNKLVELQLLKTKMYKTFLSKKKIENNKIKLYLKKIAHIIYEYHINNKTILFINFPTKLVNNISYLKNKIKHLFISKTNWVNGFITNKTVNITHQLLKNIQKSKSSNKNFSFDLIVIFNPTNNQILTEGYTSNIPTIVITEEIFNPKTPILKQSYKILGHFKFVEEKINNNFFFSILHAILKQTVIKKKLALPKYMNKNQTKQKFRNNSYIRTKNDRRNVQ